MKYAIKDLYPTPVYFGLVEDKDEIQKEFSDCIKHGSKPEVSGTEGRDVIAVLQAVVESANTGKVLDIKEFM